jgi:hypothetical protein
MKLLISILLFVSWFSTAQSKKYLLLDAESKIPIEQANIDFLNGSGTHTDAQGNFSLDKNASSIRISYIGYQSLDLKINILSDTIFLNHSTEVLAEVNVAGEIRKYQKIFPKRAINNYFMENFGTGAPISTILMKAIFIQNESKDTSKLISKIILYPTDYNSVSLGRKAKFKKQKDQKYAPFKINLYTVDTLIGIPVRQLFTKDITVQLQEGETKLIYELTLEQQRNFPAEGIFISISTFDKEYYEAIGFKTGPAFKTIGISEQSAFKVYEKSFAFYEEGDLNAKWFRDKSMWDRKNTYYVGLEIY